MPQIHTLMTITELREYIRAVTPNQRAPLPIETYFTPLIKWIKERIEANQLPFQMGWCTPSFVLRALPPTMNESSRSVAQAFRFLEFKPLPIKHWFHGKGYVQIWLTRQLINEGDTEDYRIRWTRSGWEDYIKALDSLLPPSKPRTKQTPAKQPAPQPPKGKLTLEEKCEWMRSRAPIRRKKKLAKMRKTRKQNDITRHLDNLHWFKRRGPNNKSAATALNPPDGFDYDADRKYWQLKIRLMRMKRHNRPIPSDLQQQLDQMEIDRNSNAQ